MAVNFSQRRFTDNGLISVIKKSVIDTNISPQHLE